MDSLITLQPATDADREFLISVFASTRAEELQALSWNPVQAEMFINLQYNAQQQSYRVGYPSAENNLIFFQEQPVGRMLIDRSTDEIRLIDIAILPTHRNHGLGTDLIGRLLDEGTKKGLSVVLSVFHTNPAIHLYERLGFIKFDEESLYWKMRWLPEQIAFNSTKNPAGKDLR